MNRVFRTYGTVDALLRAAAPEPPSAALLVDRAALIRLLKQALYRMHLDRQALGDAAHAPERLREIRYWEDVLGWVKEREGSHVVIVNSTREGSR